MPPTRETEVLIDVSDSSGTDDDSKYVNHAPTPVQKMPGASSLAGRIGPSIFCLIIGLVIAIWMKVEFMKGGSMGVVAKAFGKAEDVHPALAFLDLMLLVGSIVAITLSIVSLWISQPPRDEGPITEYKLQKKLGEGAFGAVYRASKVFLGDDKPTDVALKFLKLSSAEETNDGIKEAMRMSRCHHKNCLKFHEVFMFYKGVSAWRSLLFRESAWGMCMSLEICDGDLSDELKKWAGDPSQWPGYRGILRTFTEIVAGINHLHDLGIIHMDLKPENVFMSPDHGHIRIGDLGLTTETTTKGKDVSGDCAGTPGYIAPEVIREQPYSTKADNWSLGCILIDMIEPIDHPPGWSFPRVVKMVREQKHLPLDGEWKCLKEDETADLVEMLSPDNLNVAVDCILDRYKDGANVVGGPRGDYYNYPVQKLLRMCLQQDKQKRASSDQILELLEKEAF